MYIPVLLLVIITLIVYVVAFVFKIKYTKKYLQTRIDQSNYIFLLIINWLFYLSIPFFFLTGFLYMKLSIVGIVIGIIEICLLYFGYVEVKL